MKLYPLKQSTTKTLEKYARALLNTPNDDYWPSKG